MAQRCPRIGCSSKSAGLDFGQVVCYGSYWRKSDSKIIPRFLCLNCKRTFSTATLSVCFRQHKRRVNEPLRVLLCSGVSMRRCARLLGIHRVTVAKKLKFLATQARLFQKRFLEHFGAHKLAQVQFDEMESFEHTKLKPLSIAMAVTKERHILNFQVASMPAKGLLSSKAIKKYGFRKDERTKAMTQMLENLRNIVAEKAVFESDENPHYPKLLKKSFPHALHLTTPGRRGCTVGQGELKKIPWDPLFSFNHTAAMLRANVNRLFRKTWCTTKKPAALFDHLSLYAQYHNQLLAA